MNFLKSLYTPLTLTLLIMIPLAGFLLLYPLPAPPAPLDELNKVTEEFEQIMLTGYGHDSQRKYIADIIYYTYNVPNLTDSDIILATPRVKTNSFSRKSSFSLHGGPLHGIKDEHLEYYLFANEITQHYSQTLIPWSNGSKLYRTNFYILERNSVDGDIRIIFEWESSVRAAGYLLHDSETNSLTVHICGDEGRTVEIAEDFTPEAIDVEVLQGLCG